MKNPPSAAGTAQLVAAIDARIRELDAEGEMEYTGLRNLSDQMREIGKRIEEINDEIKTLDKLRKGYLNGSRPKAERKRRGHKRESTPRPTAAEATRLPGATDAVLSFMSAAAGHRMKRQEATDTLEQAILAGAVGTRATDPLKMAGTTIGNMIRTGYLAEEGEYVVLLRAERKRPGAR